MLLGQLIDSPPLLFPEDHLCSHHRATALLHTKATHHHRGCLWAKATACYSGTTLVEEDRVIAMYHGVEVGNMVAVASDPLLLNWRKVAGPVIPYEAPDEPPLPYGVFDPCVWEKVGAYYALSQGIVPFRPEGHHFATNFLFRSEDLEHWEYLHPFVEGDRFTRLGDDGACPSSGPSAMQPMARSGTSWCSSVT